MAKEIFVYVPQGLFTKNAVVDSTTANNIAPLFSSVDNSIVGETCNSVAFQRSFNKKILYAQNSKTVTVNDLDIITLDRFVIVVNLETKEFVLPFAPIPGVGLTGNKYQVTYLGLDKSLERLNFKLEIL